VSHFFFQLMYFFQIASHVSQKWWIVENSNVNW
jgi:hypothetical protein